MHTVFTIHRRFADDTQTYDDVSRSQVATIVPLFTRWLHRRGHVVLGPKTAAQRQLSKTELMPYTGNPATCIQISVGFRHDRCHRQRRHLSSHCSQRLRRTAGLGTRHCISKKTTTSFCHLHCLRWIRPLLEKRTWRSHEAPVSCRYFTTGLL